MKKFILFCLLCFSAAIAIASAGNDSLAYQLQRRKINAMLAQREAKFGQYDESLNKHSGIFGMQTKKDIQNSNDILTDIVATDDTIYRQLKILLDYHVFQEKRFQIHSKEVEQSNAGYLSAINKLRQQVEQVKADADKQQQQYAYTKNILMIALVLMAAGVLGLLFFKKRVRS